MVGHTLASGDSALWWRTVQGSGFIGAVKYVLNFIKITDNYDHLNLDLSKFILIF